MQTSTACVAESQYFPPLVYFQSVLKHSKLILEGHEHFQKGGYRNRCQIAGPNGLQMLSIPLESGKNQQKPIREVRVANDENWQIRHWRSIQTAYGKAPYFEYYIDDIKPLFEKKWDFLFDLNLVILESLKLLLQLDFDIFISEKYLPEYPESTQDMRNAFRPKTRLENQESLTVYPQVFESKSGFLPNLSILDLLFCTGPEALLYLE